MKRRHPRQVVDHAALRPGDEYALVRASEAPDAPRQTFVSCELMTFAEALDSGNTEAARAALGRHPAERGRVRFTTHDIHGEIVVAVWRWDDALENNWPFAAMDDHRGHHEMFVPSADWAADPRVHVVDWVNPGDVCEAGLTWAEEEAKLRRRAHNAMRKALGFDD